MEDRDNNAKLACDYLVNIINYLINHKDKVNCSYYLGRDNTIIKLKVDRNDMGCIIGREGKNIKSLRTLLSSGFAGRRNEKIVLELSEIY